MRNIFWSSGHPSIMGDIVKSDGCYVYDDKGKSFLDLESGVWCTSVGHSNPHVNNEIIDQLKTNAHTGFVYYNPIIEQASDKVLEITGLIGGKCEFLSSGSEAVEYGMKLSRWLNPGKMALTFSESYFGAYGDASAKSKDSWYVYDRLNCSCGADGCIGECEEFASIPFDKVSIFLFEPGSSSGHVRFASRSLIKKIADKIQNNGGVIVVNEVTTGIGRTGKWFGFQHYDIYPDIVACGKGIGNGYPVSVAAISSRITDRGECSSFRYAQSHQNDPLGARAILAVLNYIQSNNLIEEGDQVGDYLQQELESLKREFAVIKSVRARGLMMAIEFEYGADDIFKALLEDGIIVCKRPGLELLRIDPPLIMKREQAAYFISKLKLRLASLKIKLAFVPFLMLF